ncbi:MAG: SpoIID/LytB domain-containing protein [Chloroflexia bacterium]
MLPNEWRPGWPTESLSAGAMAVKSYAWYHVNRGGKWPGLGADVMDSTCDQVYNPAVSYASTSKAVDATWGYSATRNDRVHVCYYRAGSQGDGSDPGNDIMYQWGSEYWARQGKSWSWILSYYYDNIVISQGRMSLVINKGATFSPVYKVKITSTAPPGTTRIRLSNSGATTSGFLSKGATYAYANPISWNLSSVAYGGSQANGKRTVYAQLRNSQGAWSAVMSDTILLDTARPRIESMSVGFLERSVVSASSIAVRARWTGVDATSGVVRYQVQQSTDGGRYVWATDGTTVSGYTVRAPVGTTYRFRVRALDQLGRWSVWTYTSSFAASRYQEDSSTVKYPAGAWTRDDSEQASGGYWKFSNSANAEVVFRFKGSAASWVGVRGPQYGKVDVWVDGASAGVRDLYAPTLQSRTVILSRSWKEVGSHVVRLKARDTADRPRVLVDAFGVLR